ncbi:uncharacterized protein LOC128832183 [Malaclemys terrapin pileata]|uniref:uncharacterized protein LOC128832183 n=1 Tax=Malaclemys terrapin pileata TaxID=2991368 RepID=UPI0023A7BD0C|nr:uncharacterized protein LOC128832183 [Malaclemys terrapin pileata]
MQLLENTVYMSGDGAEILMGHLHEALLEVIGKPLHEVPGESGLIASSVVGNFSGPGYHQVLWDHCLAEHGGIQPGFCWLSRSMRSFSVSEILSRVMSLMVTCFELGEAASVSRATPASPSQRLAQIRRRKKRTQDKMFSELMGCSQAEAAQWRENMSQYQRSHSELEERWRQEDQQATQTLLGLMREQTDTLRRLVDVLQDRRQEDRAPLQSICNHGPPPQSHIPPSPKVPRRRGGRGRENCHSTPADCSSNRRLSFPKFW